MIPQHRYVKKYACEIDAAIAEEYPTGCRFINTKHIAKRVMENPERYPLLSSRSSKTIKGDIGLYLSKVMRYVVWSIHQNSNCGTVYVVTQCREKSQRNHRTNSVSV